MTINHQDGRDDQPDKEQEDDDDEEEINGRTTGEASADKERANRNDEREYDDGENDNAMDEDEELPDEQEKVTIKEDLIDDDLQPMEINDDDEQEVPVKEKGTTDAEPPKKKVKKSSQDTLIYNERFGYVCSTRTEERTSHSIRKEPIRAWALSSSISSLYFATRLAISDSTGSLLHL